jgi:hydrogenase expression/formation protein HypC
MCLGIPGQIIEVSDVENQLAIVDISGVRRPVNIACIVDEHHPIETCVGDWVLVHVGFALNRLDPEEAQLTLDLLDELAEAHAADLPARRTGEAVSK